MQRVLYNLNIEGKKDIRICIFCNNNMNIVSYILYFTSVHDADASSFAFVSLFIAETLWSKLYRVSILLNIKYLYQNIHIRIHFSAMLCISIIIHKFISRFKIK